MNGSLVFLVPTAKLAPAHQLAAVGLAGGTPTLILGVLLAGLLAHTGAVFVPVLRIHARYRGAQAAVVLLTFGLVRPQLNTRAMRKELNAAVVGAKRAACLR